MEELKKMYEMNKYFSKEFGITMTDFDSWEEYMTAVIAKFRTEDLLDWSSKERYQFPLELIKNELKKRGEV